MLSRRWFLPFTALLGLSMAAPALAGSLAAPWTTISQVRMNTTMGIVTTLSMKQRLEKRLANGSAGQYREAASTGSAGDTWGANDTGIAHDRDVSEQARRTFIGGLAQSSGQAVANEADQILGDVQTTFSRMVTPYGLRADDFTDVMTAYMIVMWMSVNQQTTLPQTAQVQAVRNQMRGAFSSADNIADPRQRQLAAESIMYQTCMAVIVREQAQAQAKPELLGTLASAIDQNMSRQGIHLADLALTNQGLVKR